MRRFRVFRERRLKQVIVTLKPAGGVSLAFSGLLYEFDEDCFVLRNATALEQGENGSNVGVDGELILQRSDIAFVQRP